MAREAEQAAEALQQARNAKARAQSRAARRISKAAEIAAAKAAKQAQRHGNTTAQSTDALSTLPAPIDEELFDASAFVARYEAPNPIGDGHRGSGFVATLAREPQTARPHLSRSHC